MQALAASLEIGFTMSGKGALHWHASSGAYRAGGGGIVLCWKSSVNLSTDFDLKVCRRGPPPPKTEWSQYSPGSADNLY